MQTHATASKSATRRHRPKTLTVFAAAFAAGAVLAYGVDRMVDVHVVRVEPQVESEPIFVALRSLPQGAPITVWDVALKDWPKAMLPSTALKADASFDGMVLRHPVREGQPLLSVQLVRDGGYLPGAAIAVAPAAAGPADARSPAPTSVSAGAVGEPFVPAAPAEPPATTTAAVNPPADASVLESAPASTPAADTAAVASAPAAVVSPAAEVAPAAQVTPAVVAAPVTVAAPVAQAMPAQASSEPAPAVTADRFTRDDSPAIVAVVQPRSTDVDEPVVAPAATPTSAPEAAETAATPTAPAAAAIVQEPLAPPVPALPPTDIERSLARFGRVEGAAEKSQPAVPERAAAVDHVVAGNAPPSIGDSRPATAEQTTSVLDRTTEAEPPTPSQSGPKLHLVVPERIALAVDASFAQPQTAPPAEPVAQAAEATRGATASAASTATPTTGSQGRTAARKPAAANTAARKQPAPRQPAAKSQQPQGRGTSAWLPSFLGGSRQR